MGFRGAITSDGRTDGLWFASTSAFSCIIHLVTLKLMVELIFLNWIVILAGAVSVAFYWLFVIVFNTHAISIYFQPEIDNVYFRMFSNSQFWLALIFLPLIALVPDATIKYFQMMYFPTISDRTIKSRGHLATIQRSNMGENESEVLDANKTNKSTKKNDKNKRKSMEDSMKDNTDLQPLNEDISANMSNLPMINKDPNAYQNGFEPFKELEEDD
jgi:magnesium-transporting ATPase (P-type)